MTKKSHFSNEIQKAMMTWGDRRAVEFLNQSFTFADLDLLTDTLMSLLKKNKVNIGLIALDFPRGIAEYTAILTLLKGQWAALNLGSDYSQSQIRQKCVDLPITHLLVHSSLIRNYEQHEFIFCQGEICLFRNTLRKTKNTTLRADCIWTLATSGSSGQHKIAEIDALNLLGRARGEIRDFSLSSNDRILNYLTFSHDLGLNQLLSAFLSGGCLVIHKYVFLKDLIDLLENHSITTISSIPNLWRSLLKNAELMAGKKMKLRLLTISGGSLSIQEIQQLQEMFKECKIVKTYGQTETFRSLITYVDNNQKHFSSLGKPLAEVNLKLINIKGENCLPDEPGELIHYGQGSMLGYLEADDLSHTKFTDDGGIRTGDFFKVDTDGEFYFLGREDGMQKINGIRFYPQEIENALIQHEDIIDCAVLLAKDQRENETLVAFLVTTKDFIEKELKAYLIDHLAANLIPRHFIPLPTMPKTGPGKINRQELKLIAQSFFLK